MFWDQYGRTTPRARFFGNVKTGTPSYKLFCGQSSHSVERANVKG